MTKYYLRKIENQRIKIQAVWKNNLGKYLIEQIHLLKQEECIIVKGVKLNWRQVVIDKTYHINQPKNKEVNSTGKEKTLHHQIKPN